MKRSFLRDTDFSYEEFKEVFELAHRYKKLRGAGVLDVLKGESWGLIFFKKSTRTRLSFEVGVHELGGNPMVINASDLQISRGESIEDTAKIMGRYLHGLVIRAYEQEVVDDFAKYSKLPVVNALTDLLHPCQSACDMFTMVEKFSKAGEFNIEAIKGKKFVFFGDTACNMAYSLALIGNLFDVEVVLCGPEEFSPVKDLDKLHEEANLEKKYKFITDPKLASKGADVFYTDVWVSMGKEEEKEQRLKTLAPYQVNEGLMALGSDSSIFMHCLPAHKQEEVSEGVLNGARSVIFDEAENRLHIQKAIMSYLVKTQK